MDERVDPDTDPSPYRAEDWGNDDVRGRSGIAATEESFWFAVAVRVHDDRNQAVGGA